jgi:hypothetical protein
MIVARDPWPVIRSSFFVIREGGALWAPFLYGGNGERRDYGERIETIAMIVIRGS